MSVKIKKLNDIKIKPIPTSDDDNKPMVGEEIFGRGLQYLYNNIFLVAKTRSGKSTAIFHLLKNSVNKNTKVMFFVSTIYIDPCYKAMTDWLKKKKISYETFTDFKDDESGTDLIKEFLKSTEGEQEEEDDKKKIKSLIEFGDGIDEKKERKPKKMAPEYLIICDDQSSALRINSVTTLLKKSRHSHSRVIISSQFLNDLNLSARKQISVCLIFRSFSVEKLKSLYSDLDLGIEFDEFQKLYDIATEEPYSFLFIDIRRGRFLKNFSHELILE